MYNTKKKQKKYRPRFVEIINHKGESVSYKREYRQGSADFAIFKPCVVEELYLQYDDGKRIVQIDGIRKRYLFAKFITVEDITLED